MRNFETLKYSRLIKDAASINSFFFYKKMDVTSLYLLSLIDFNKYKDYFIPFLLFGFNIIDSIKLDRIILGNPSDEWIITYGRATREYSLDEIRAARNRIMKKRIKSFSTENQKLCRQMYGI